MADFHRDTSFFDRIKELVPLEQYLTEHCGVEFVSDGPARLAACCPFHEERTPSFKVSHSDQHPWQVWRCYGACAGSDLDRGTVIDAVMKREGFTESIDAARWLNETYDLGLDMNTEAYNRFNELRQRARERITAAQEALEADSVPARAARAYLERRGFEERTIRHFNLGVDTEMSRAGRLSIPLYDKANHPVSVDGRALFDWSECRACGERVTAKEMHERAFRARKLEEKGQTPDFDWASCPHCQAPDSEARVKWLSRQYPKYRFERGLDKSKLLYHQFEATRELNRDSMRALAERELYGLFLCEGYADAWSAWQAGQTAVCSYNGSVLSDWQARQAVEIALGGAEVRPIILIPDMDAAGRLRVEDNIHKLQAVKLRSDQPPLEIQVLMGIDEMVWEDESGERHSCKDLGEVLEHFGTEAVARLLRENRRPAEEWIIRGILDARMKSGEPFHTRKRQMELIADVLKSVRHKTALDHLVPLLAERWELREKEARRWFQMNHSTDTTASHEHLISTMDDAQREALIFLRDGNTIPLGYPALDRALPRGGVRRGWLAMFLGKALASSEPVLTPWGWKPIGELVVGDEVVDPIGGSARVVGVYPQGLRQLYRVSFSDGSSLECDGDHLWYVREDGAPSARLLTTLEISARLAEGELGPRIPAVAPVRFAGETGEDAPDLCPYAVGGAVGRLVAVADEARRVDETLAGGGDASDLRDDVSASDVLAAARDILRREGLASELKYGTVAARERFLLGFLQSLVGARALEILSEEGAGERGRPLESLARDLLERPGVALRASLASCPEALYRDLVFLIRSLGGLVPAARAEGGERRRLDLVLPAGWPDAVRSPSRSSAGPPAWGKRFLRIEPTGVGHAVCIKVDSPEGLFVARDFIVTHNSGTGKAQPLDAAVLTPTGWRAMGDLQVGDRVLDPFGGEAAVVGVYPQGKREIWEVRTVDGRRARCDLEHLWPVKRASRAAAFEVLTLGEIVERARAGERFLLSFYQEEEISSESEVSLVEFFAAEPVGRFEAQCIALDSASQLYVTEDNLITHNTMMSTQLLANMAAHDVHSIFFSLEQQKATLYVRAACQVLGKSPAEVEGLILAADPDNHEIDPAVRASAQAQLREVTELYKKVYIVDNVPGDSTEAVEMTPRRIEAIIREINMTKFRNRSADVVIIDHLGILRPGADAPRSIQNDELQAAGYIMEELFHVSKATDTFILVLQQLPKEVPPGVWFPKDAGRGGSKQTDYCDIILGAYRPEQESGIDEDEKARRRGQYKLALLKNRHGAEEIAHLIFDTNTLRIVPAPRAPMPDDDIADQPRVEIPEGAVVSDGETAQADGAAETVSSRARRSHPGDELLAGLEEGAIDTLKLAENLGLSLELDDVGDEEESEVVDWS